MTYQNSSLRACVFIDSSNPELPNQIMNHSSHPFIKPPFPPLIDPKDLLIISKDNKPSRSPNAFIIYRKVFLKTTRDQGYFLPMTIVSSMASKSWDKESDEVRDYYKKLAKEAYKYRTEKFPKKVKRRRKKEPWNANIAFQNDLHNTFFDNSNPSGNLSSSPELFLSSENMFSSPNIEQQINEINEIPLFNEYSSPSLSNNSSIMSSPEITLHDNIPEFLNHDNSQNILHNDLEQFNIDSYSQLLNQLNQDNNNYISFNNNLNNLNSILDTTNTTNTTTANQSDETAEDSNVENLPLYPPNFLPYQNVLGINLNPIGLGYENTYS
ncbi:uncharacterized protein OCT59_010240 [Rhizophagus irregularis]|uniref:MATA-HMG n=5 Tax=Rhizophagus irregularis TaxID=588596 RepID=A0A1B1EW31_9GLOM|nr:MATA-HMG [Rhizophagus irregularis]GBC38628.1 hypothetical protein GLOIN_2v1669580 [Rhizophagus irregularis DAOM 181602=DAOM 197198]ANQ32998.1 MATA-HMG [Rhizophagus irregularis]ANQ32999.1 MATA-HMG [Rhizophagus irregularis]UZO18933.1 hypothetical protein OCT59_010240 [Rhizophagus irregularis]